MLKQTLYEDDDDREDRVDRAAILEDKVKDYEEHLLAIEEALWGLGCFKDEEGNFQPAAEVQIVKGYNHDIVAQAPQSGINIRHALSFRGQQKAEEYFDRLDEDRDGFLTFEDFRAMASLGRFPAGTVHDNVHASWDAWKMHMADAGAPPDFVGRVTRDQFVRYRTWLERRPREVHLEPEVTRAGLGILPQTQQHWVALKGFIEEVIVDREYQELLRKESDGAKAELADLLKGKKDDGPKLPLKERFYDEILDLDEMQYVLVTAGVIYPRGLLAHLMRERAQREKLLEHFSAKKMRRVYGDSPQKMLQFMSPQVRGGVLVCWEGLSSADVCARFAGDPAHPARAHHAQGTPLARLEMRPPALHRLTSRHANPLFPCLLKVRLWPAWISTALSATHLTSRRANPAHQGGQMYSGMTNVQWEVLLADAAAQEGS